MDWLVQDEFKIDVYREQKMKPLRKAIPILALCVVMSAPLYAHTQLSESTPANDAVLVEVPEQILLTFSEAVRLTAVVIEHDSESRSIEIEVKDPTKSFAVSLPELVPGNYVVQWRALSEDTHVISGEVRFTIEA